MKPKPLHSFYSDVSTLLPFTVLREWQKKKWHAGEGEEHGERCHFFMPFCRGRVNIKYVSIFLRTMDRNDFQRGGPDLTLQTLI